MYMQMSFHANTSVGPTLENCTFLCNSHSQIKWNNLLLGVYFICVEGETLASHPMVSVVGHRVQQISHDSPVGISVWKKMSRGNFTEAGLMLKW